MEMGGRDKVIIQVRNIPTNTVFDDDAVMSYGSILFYFAVPGGQEVGEKRMDPKPLSTWRDSMGMPTQSQNIGSVRG